MEELTKEQRQIIENKIKQEVENFNTFLDRQYCIDKIYKTIINRIKSHYDIGFDFLTIIEKNITEIDKISYEVIAIEEIKQILNIEDNIRYISGVFYIFGLSRTNLKTQIHEVVDILSLFETYPLVFDHCIFTQRIGYFDQITNIKKISFLNCEFEEQIYLNFQECLDSFQMDNCVFEDRVTIKGKFNDNVYFNNSHFKDYADFHECEFEKIANFYGVRFDKTPNFSQAIFKGNLNAVNTNLNFTFDDLQERIKQEYAFYETQRTAKEAGVIPKLYQEKSLDKFANDFRDSFRTFKNALIKDNNALDASNFHKYELYCKEIELKNKKGKTFKDVVDRWQLFFYCKLCDHHTDILQSLNSLILVIGIFVISSVAMVFSFNYSLGYKPILEHWYFSLDFYNHHINSIIQDNYLLMIFVNLMILFIYLGLVGFALCLKYMREFFIIISYVITLLVLAVSPKILIPAMGIFTDKRAMLDPLSVFGGIYTIIFGFVAFSFIKTIRKNSIVPS
ncbi:pentapeptide repeat-containing protein [Campylobacter jejuni]|nr:pentapeptide repeat-containing protein [Campylobacter jejuni]MCW1586584.1 pentapeptide repeat-containing protein [Campylobacter jejuni]HEF2669642.1 pentapeptide repeat-containing protein [Campylobacter jejuni]